MQLLNAEQIARIQTAKVPVDNDMCPKKSWIVSLSIESEMPSAEELKQLRSYIEFDLLRGIYQPSYGQRVLDEALPLVPGHNTLIFKKVNGDNAGWCYRRASWEIGPTFVPWTGEKGFHPHTLVEAMDREMGHLSSMTTKWAEWKKEHPDIFPIAKG